MGEKMEDAEVYSRFADIAAWTRLEDIEAMLHAAGILVIDRGENRSPARG